MKKLICLMMSLVSVFVFASCEKQPKDETIRIKYYAQTDDLLDAIKERKETVALIAEPTLSEILYLTKYSIQLDVQELYGEYPQDVVVAKKSVIESDGEFITIISNGIRQGVSWLKLNAHDGVEQVYHNLPQNATPILNAYITSDTIVRCNISFTSAISAKSIIQSYFENLNSVQENTAVFPSNEFFYDGLSTSANLEGEYTIVTPDGTPALSLAQLMYTNRQSMRANNSNGNVRQITYKVVAPETISTYVKNADESMLGDVVVLPVLDAVKLIGDGDVYQMLGIATKGNSYIISNQNISTVNDLKGKTIAVAGQGEVGDLTLQCVLNKNQLVYKKAE